MAKSLDNAVVTITGGTGSFGSTMAGVRTATPMLKGSMDTDGYLDEVKRRTPLGEIGTPKRIAETAVGLLKMDWVTGQALMSDGGSSLNTGRSTWRT